ncbi:hypothetical protein UCRPC4_g05085 [Phaeomoniella chlamydospora]|uniref:Cell wall protein n=1 Tax=Phaeomoniella chlamydospora TaxID=158046 RepID=A0A0G2GMW8_PHACM|nr:hypothetical protein UCRPC4_g05085 [Phaeomoniella chlamydospora]
MFMKSITIIALVALTEARFGQEQCQPALGDIQAVTSGGAPGEAATIAGGAISDLLAAANPCDQLKTADNIIATLGSGADAVKAAKEFINCEKNFNPFVQDTPTLCSDPTLPTTAALRGILSKIDPSIGGADVANQLAAQSLTTAFDATGKSMADVFAANGFSNFTTEDAAGNKDTAATGSASTSTGTSAETTTAAATAATTSAAADDTSADECVADSETSTSAAAAAAATTLTTVTTSAAAAAATSAATDSSTAEDPTATGGASITNTVSSIAGLDFGLCNPGMIFESGLNGRAATEFTFQAADSKIRAIQGEALNFNIITNRICDELTNQCESNQAAKDACATAQTAVIDLGRVRSTADTWNTMLGFDGQDTNPDNTSTEGEPTA